MNVFHLLKEIEEGQYQKLLKLARQFRPNLTEEDLLQPCDYPELENHPLFRYEEGVLEGIKTVQMALLARAKDELVSSTDTNLVSNDLA